MKKYWFLLIFTITIIVSLFVFIKYDGYVGMFDSFKKEKISTTPEIVQTLPKKETTTDTIYVYHVIVGSFKNYENAIKYSENYDFSDILGVTENGYYRVSKNTHYNKKDALNERNELGGNIWVLKDFIVLDI